MPSISTEVLLVQDTASSATNSRPSSPPISRLRLIRSPSGSTNSSASMDPTCVAVTKLPAAACAMPNSSESASSSGCA